MTATDVTPDTLLRELSDEQFFDRYSCDRVTATVLSNSVRHSVQHTATGLLHRAFSPIIALCYDFAIAVCGPPEQNYRMSAVTNGLPVFLGTMSDGVRISVEEYGADKLVPGDLIIYNDVYRVGNHLNDVCFVRPIFLEDRIVSFVALRAHLIDVGGTVPGGFSASKRNIYEDGLVIGPRLLYHAEKPVKETFSMIFDNVRMAELTLPDLETMQSCCRLGEELLQATIAKYGIDAYLGSLRYSCDVSAESMRRAISAVPDGDYSASGSLDADGIDANEEYWVNLTLRKRGHQIEADFSGTSRQARTSINCGPRDAKTAIGVGLKMLLDPESQFTSGTYRDIDVVIPPGTVASALPPDGAVFCYYQVEALIITVMLQALEPALGVDSIGGDFGVADVHNANGTYPDGTPWFAAALAGGEHGARGGDRYADGDGATCSYILNLMSPSTEALEAGYPFRIMRREFVTDTAGPGENRGGPSIAKDILYTLPGEHVPVVLRFRHPSGVGIYGGHDGRLGGVWVFNEKGGPLTGRSTLLPDGDDAYVDSLPVAGTFDPVSKAPDVDGEFHYYGRRSVWSTDSGATWRYVTNAGGGWGDPLNRDPERVKRDVRDEYISREAALRDFGVVILGDPEKDPEGLSVDSAATESRRRSMRATG